MRNGLVGAELSGAARACAQAEPDHHLAELAGRAGALRQELFGQLQKSPSGVVDNHTGVCVCVVSAQPRPRSPAPAALLPAASPGSSDIPGVCVLLWAPPCGILWQLQRPERRRKISDPEKIIFSCVRCNVWLPHSISASPERADYVGMSYVYRAGR